MINQAQLSKTQLSKELHDLGLAKGDLVMVHASLRQLGPIEGGAKTVIQSITDVIGTTGTMLMILGSRDGDAFIAEKTPADPEVGVLAEVFRQYDKVLVNDHPAARFCAYGPLSEILLNNPPLHNYYAENSVLDRFTRNKGKVLRLGADLDTTTLTHYAENLANVSPKRAVRRRYNRADIGEQWIECLDDCGGIQDWPKGDYFSQILIDYLAIKEAKTGKVGQCTAELFCAQSFVSFAVEWMESHLTNEKTK